MCGRFTYKLTWEEIVRLYRLALDQPAQNTRARYNACPTTTIDTIVGGYGPRAYAELLKPAPEDPLQTWPVSKRVDSSRASGDDATLKDRVSIYAPDVTAPDEPRAERYTKTGLER
jgi:putative SOS response-associated peptidase YedK